MAGCFPCSPHECTGHAQGGIRGGPSRAGAAMPCSALRHAPTARGGELAQRRHSVTACSVRPSSTVSSLSSESSLLPSRCRHAQCLVQMCAVGSSGRVQAGSSSSDPDARLLPPLHCPARPSRPLPTCSSGSTALRSSAVSSTTASAVMSGRWPHSSLAMAPT